MKCMVKSQRETLDKGTGEFVGQQEDYGSNARFDWEPV